LKDVKSASFSAKPLLHHVIQETGRVSGITVVGSQLFAIQRILFSGRGIVDVYITNTFTLTRKIEIPDSKNLVAIVSCVHNNCLYLCDDTGEKSIIHRYDLQLNNVINKWSIGGASEGLSVTSSYNVLVTLPNIKQIQEYTPSGGLIREINLSRCMNTPHHSIQLSNDQFVVCYSKIINKGESGVCIIGMNGHIIQSYGGQQGSDVGQMGRPCQIAVDKHGYNVMMLADIHKHRVEILSPSLTHLGYIEIPGHQLIGPRTLHLDELNRRLYVGEFGAKRICVLNI